MYELAKPVRVLVTLFVTQLVVAALRKRGFMAKPADQDKIRNLVREGTQQTRVQMRARRNRIQTQIGEKRRVMGVRMRERRTMWRHLRMRMNRKRSDILSRMRRRRNRNQKG